MARIVLGLATSHGPMLTTPPLQWDQRVGFDRGYTQHAFKGKTYKFDDLGRLRAPEKLELQITPDKGVACHAAGQRAISTQRLKQKIGRHMQVIIDRAGPRQAEGRGKADAPDIDGKVHVTSHRPLRLGEIVSVKIESSDAYGLFGTAV